MSDQSVVGGTRMERSLADFWRACEVYIDAEQQQLAPDTTLIVLLCDAVRLGREHERLVTAPPHIPPSWVIHLVEAAQAVVTHLDHVNPIGPLAALWADLAHLRGVLLASKMPPTEALRGPEEGKVADFLRDVLAERQEADITWPPINSHHEGYAVLLEEVDEYWEIVRQKAYLRNTQAMYKELVQVAAVAWRIVRDLGLEEHCHAE